MENLNQFKKILASLLLAGLILSSCSNDEESRNFGQGGGQQPTVEAVQIQSGSLPLSYRVTGEMRARNQTAIHPEINARITEVLVENGDQVNEGDPLVRLRDDDIREQLNQAEYDYEVAQSQLIQAEANLERLEAEYRRTNRLAEQDFETELEIETLEANIKEAEASVELARSQKNRAASQIREQENNLDNTVIRATTDGVVGGRNAETGMMADPGTQLFQIGDTDQMTFFASITEEMSNNVMPGDEVEITSGTGYDEPIKATVSRISPFLNPVSHTTVAEIEVENDTVDLRPGMFVSGNIHFGDTDLATLVPKTALYENPVEGETGVYTADVVTGEMNISEDGSMDSEDAEEGAFVTEVPVDVNFTPVEIIAEGNGMAGIRGIDDSKEWVITVGQSQLAERQSEEAFVHVVDMEHVMQMQDAQDRDLEQRIFEEIQ